MSFKRTATTDLNHDNWADEEEPEAAGVFKKASEDQLSKRVIISAKRRIGGTNASKSEEEPAAAKPSVFSGFGGFSKTPAFGAGGSPFSFLKSTPAASAPSFLTKTDTESILEQAKPSGGIHSGLAGLNKAFISWVQNCVTKNPDCILTPIFKDYENYVQDLKKDDNKDKTISTAISSTATVPTFGQAAASSTLASSTPSNFFGSVPALTFGSSTNFSSMSKPAVSSIFANVAKPSQLLPPVPSNGTDQDNDDEDTPPKVEFTPVVEEDSVYSKRCKVFVKKDGNFGDRGVGTLYIKKVQVADKDRYQLIVRADTSLGNLLLNILLAEAVPTQRMGKNNVMVVCAPITGEPVSTVLLRVKTESDADDLLKEVEKYKK